MKDQLSAEMLSAIEENPNFKIIPPAGFIDIIALEKNARLIVTDSGGLQKEAFFFQKPCVILRPQTEWIEILENGNAILADASYERIIAASLSLLNKTDFTYPAFYGDGKAAHFICEKIIQDL
jgi:UDP-GlcNAc3NAcA epimerase